MKKNFPVPYLNFFAILLVTRLFIPLVYAHEVYVLSPTIVRNDFAMPTHVSFFKSVLTGSNVPLVVIVFLATLVAFACFAWFSFSEPGKRVDIALKYFAPLGMLIVRITLAMSFFYSAWAGVFLGPELHLASIPFYALVHIGMYAVGLLLFVGLFTGVAAGLGLLIFILATIHYGFYMTTYASYIGELVVLLLLGAPKYSLDMFLGQNKPKWRKLIPYEMTCVRMLFGIALIYAAIDVKFLHAYLSLDVVNQYNLTRFHWLFPPDPLLIVLGAGVVETVIGVCILVGFQIRLVALVTFFYLTLSLVFFRESVWPHFVLYGILSALLLNNGGLVTVDSWIRKRLCFHSP